MRTRLAPSRPTTPDTRNEPSGRDDAPRITPHRTLVGRQLTAHHARQLTRAATNRDVPFTSAGHRPRTNMYEGRRAFCGRLSRSRLPARDDLSTRDQAVITFVVSRGGDASSPRSTGRTDGRASSAISSSRRTLGRRRDDRRCIGSRHTLRNMRAGPRRRTTPDHLLHPQLPSRNSRPRRTCTSSPTSFRRLASGGQRGRVA